MAAVVVVEGVSDQIALEALAARCGLVTPRIVPLGGAHRIAGFVAELDPAEAGCVVGMCDAGEAPVFARVLAPDDFYVCDADLEDELIRALGVAAVEDVMDANGDLARFRKLQQMPQWRGRPADAQLRRFIAAGARRKTRYAQLLVDALDLEHVPDPLAAVLERSID